MAGYERNSERTYQFGPFRLLASQRVLLEGERVVRLGSRAMDILIALVERAGELVSKRELVEIVWPHTVVVEANLAVHVAALRRALGEGDAENQYIVNSPGRGYRFVAPIRVMDGHPSAAEATIVQAPHNLPAQLTRLVGRTETLRALQNENLTTRLLSIVGPPGVGKTTLALGLAETLLSRYSDGVWFVDLAPISNGAHVASALVSALPLDIRSTDLLSGIVLALRHKRLLLVIDNCEHVIESAASAISMILRGSPTVSVIATSREPLRIEGENVYRLQPLAFPPKEWHGDPNAALAFPAIQLFVERAGGTVNGFEFAPGDVVFASEICRKLDGNPLAIELAAARVDAFGVRGLATRIDNLQFLSDSHRGTSPRQRSIGAALDWSYRLLGERDQFIVRCLAIFSGGFTLEAAAAVVPPGDGERDTASAVADLVCKSLVTVEILENGMRFRLLEITRAFALAKLAEHGERGEIAVRHCGHYDALLSAINRQPHNTLSLRAAIVELDNIRTALSWALSPDGSNSVGLRLAANTVPVWLENSLLAESITWSTAALDLLPKEHECSRDEMLLRAAFGLSSMFTEGMSARARDALNRAIAIAQQLGDCEWQLRALLGLIIFVQRAGDHRNSLALTEMAERLASQSDDRLALAMTDSVKGATLFLRGELDDSLKAVRRARRYFLVATDGSQIARWGTDHSLQALCITGRIYWHQGLFEQARKTCFDVQSEVDGSGRPTAICQALTWCNCSLFLSLEEFDLAAAAIARLKEVAEESSLQSFLAVGIGYHGRLSFIRGELAVAETDLRAALKSLADTGYGNVYVPLLGFLAELFAAQQRFDEALAASEEALERARGSEAFWWLPELIRVHGEILRLSRRANERQIEALFGEAASISSKQGALALELRATASLAKLLREQRRCREGHDLLRPVIARFSEGHNTVALRRARSQLEELRSGFS